MAELDELARIQQAHHARLLAIRETSGGLIENAWDAYAGLDTASAAAFVDEAARITLAAQEQTAALAVAYMNANDAIVGRSADLVPSLPTIRNGVPPADVYQRSVVEARRMVANGAPLEQAMNAGRARAVGAAQTDVIAANRAAISAGKSSRPWVVGYRRVLTGKSCALCATASTQRYRIADLAPIHARCDCDVAEIIGNEDPGQIINRELLAELKGTEGRPDYWNNRGYLVDEDGTIRHAKLETVRDPSTGKVLRTDAGNPVRRQVAGDPLRITTRTHGELGEIVTDRRHAFTAADDVADLELPPQPRTSSATRVADDVADELDEVPPPIVAEALDEAPAPRIKPTDPDSLSVLREAERRNVSPLRVAQERDAKKLQRAQEARRAREYEKALNADHPDVIAVAERYGVTPDEVMVARARVPEVRRWIRDEAATVQQEQFARLYQWNETSFRGPGTYRGDLPPEFDWFRGLDERERARLSRRWFSSDTSSGGFDTFAQAIASNDPALGNLSLDEIAEVWLDVDRRYEMAGAIRRGKLPSSRAYSGELDVDDLLPDLASRRISARRILSTDDLDAAGHIAAADKQYLAEEALDYLGEALTPRHGPAPYRMSFQRWEEEVRTLEYGLRNHPTEMPRNSAERLAELVPRWLDEPDLDYEELYTRIVTTAQTAGEEVPSYARIPWQ